MPMDKNGEPMLVDDEANAFWMGTVTTHYLSTPEVLDPDGDEVWAALEVKFQWRTTSSFEEIKFPANIDGIDRWGYLSGHFNFKWIMVLSVSFIRLSRPPGTKQENEIPHTRQLWKSSRFAHSGNVTIDPDTGVPTLDPKPPCNLVKVDEGWAKEGNIWYDIHMKKTNSSWGFYMSAYRTEGGDPPLETATAFMRVSGTDSYTWEIVPYNVENN